METALDREEFTELIRFAFKQGEEIGKTTDFEDWFKTTFGHKAAPLKSEPQSMDELREKFFNECTDKCGIQKGGVPKLPSMDMAPNDVFNWFKSNFKFDTMISDEELGKIAGKWCSENGTKGRGSAFIAGTKWVKEQLTSNIQ